ncbi:MAG: hypothetical protein DRJ40_06355 [Thermoprotei archaeon]|nr:MAG: hypothetical protein DRJ40_06355 [Thermoprotei archaeon]
MIELSTNVVLALGLICAFYIAWCLGANDAANPTDTTVGAGVLDWKTARHIFAVFVFLGALLQGHMVMKTIGRGVVNYIDVLGCLAIVLGAGLWITLCTWRGLPISTTHSTVGAVLGYGLVKYGIERVNWNVVMSVILSWCLTPILGITVAVTMYRITMWLLSKVKNVERIEKVARWGLIASLCFSAYSFGANDVGNATGVFISITSSIGDVPPHLSTVLLAAFGALGIVLGAYTLGYRVTNTVGFRITRLDPVTGFIAEFSNAVLVYAFTTVPYMLFGFGMPISTTHASVSSIMGVGLAKGVENIDWRTVLYIVLAWVLTVPGAALFSSTMYLLLTHVVTT